MKAEGVAKTILLSSALIASPFASPAYAKPASASASPVPEEVCTTNGREETNGTSLNGNRVLQFVDALIRHRIPSSEAERLRPCISADYEAAQRALSNQPQDEETRWIQEFLQDAGSMRHTIEFRESV